MLNNSGDVDDMSIQHSLPPLRGICKSSFLHSTPFVQNLNSRWTIIKKDKIIYVKKLNLENLYFDTLLI